MHTATQLAVPLKPASQCAADAAGVPAAELEGAGSGCAPDPVMVAEPLGGGSACEPEPEMVTEVKGALRVGVGLPLRVLLGEGVAVGDAVPL